MEESIKVQFFGLEEASGSKLSTARIQTDEKGEVELSFDSAETPQIDSHKPDFCSKEDLKQLLRWIEDQRFPRQTLSPEKFHVTLGQQGSSRRPNIIALCSNISNGPQNFLATWKPIKSTLAVSQTELGEKIQLDMTETHVLGPLDCESHKDFTAVSCNFVKSTLTSWKEQLNLVNLFAKMLSSFLKIRKLSTSKSFQITKLEDMGNEPSQDSHKKGITVIGVETMNIFLVCQLMPPVEKRPLICIALRSGNSSNMKFLCENQKNITSMLGLLGGKVTEAVHMQVGVGILPDLSVQPDQSQFHLAGPKPPDKSKPGPEALDEAKPKPGQKRPADEASSSKPFGVIKKAKLSCSSFKMDHPAPKDEFSSELAAIAREYDVEFSGTLNRIDYQFQSRYHNFFLKLDSPDIQPGESNQIRAELHVSRDLMGSFEVVEMFVIPHIHNCKLRIQKVKLLNIKSTISQILLQTWNSQFELLHHFVEKLSSFIQRNGLKSAIQLQQERDSGMMIICLYSSGIRRPDMKLNCNIFPAPSHRPLLTVQFISLPCTTVVCHTVKHVDNLVWRIARILGTTTAAAHTSNMEAAAEDDMSEPPILEPPMGAIRVEVKEELSD